MSQRLNTGKKVDTPRENPSIGVEVHKSLSAFRRLQAINARSNWEAMNIRAADKIMDTIGNYIEEMKAQLERIIKNFPPFPLGSEERVRILRSYNALRKQIDQMTFPSKTQGVMKIIADRAIVRKAGDPEVKSVDHWALHVKDLNIPELPDAATDQEIVAAIESLNATQKSLQEARAKLATNALGISSGEFTGHKWVEFDSEGAEVEYDLSEGAAELRSRELRQKLSTETIKNGIESQWSIASLIYESE